MSEIARELAGILNKQLESNPVLPKSYITDLAKQTGLTKWKLYKLLNPESDYPVTVGDFILLYKHTDSLLLEALKYIIHECNPMFDVINIKECLEIDGSFENEKDDLLRYFHLDDPPKHQVVRPPDTDVRSQLNGLRANIHRLLEARQ